MTKRAIVFALSLVAGATLAAPTFADEKDLKKDLTAVIALEGQPCGEVVDVVTQAENDYIASCKDGNKYHVYMSTKGRVVVEKQK